MKRKLKSNVIDKIKQARQKQVAERTGREDGYAVTRKTINEWLRKGNELNVSIDEMEAAYKQKAVGNIVTDPNKYAVVDEIAKQFFSVLSEDTVDIRNYLTVVNTNSGSVKLPYGPANFKVTVGNETGADMPMTIQGKDAIVVDIDVTAIVPKNLVEDTDFDLATYIEEQAREAQNQKLIELVLKGHPAGFDGVVELAAQRTTGGTLDTNKVLQAYYKLSGRHRRNGIWVIPDTLMPTVGTLTYTNGTPAFQAGSLAMGLPETLVGKEFINCDSLSEDAGATEQMVFGNFKTYGYVQKPAIGLLVDPYTVDGGKSVKFVFTLRAAGKVLNPNAFSVIEGITV